MKLFFTRIIFLVSTHPFESLFGLPLFLFYGWYLLALSGLFYPLFTLFLFLIVGAAMLFLLSKKPAFCNAATFLLGTLLFFLALFALTSHPIELVAEGRDQGTFINSALLLNATHGFSFTIPEAKPFFELYGEGKALHFPGLAYTDNGNLVPEFPLGYTAWLAGFVSVFGLAGFTLANGILYFFSGMLLYALLKRGAPLFWSFLGTLVIMGGFLPLWFLSFTLSENLALFFFLLTTEGVLRFTITKDRVTFFLTLTAALALALTRIEGWAILLIVIGIFSYRQSKITWLKTHFLQKNFWGTVWLLFALGISAWTFFLNAPYYKAIAKALLKTAEQKVSAATLSQEAFPLYHVLLEYGLLVPFLLGALSGLYLWKKKHWRLLIPMLIALPTLPYLLLPHITPDAPWMLRRFLFSLYPAFAISMFWVASLSLERLKIKKQPILWFALLILLMGVQVPAFIQLNQTSYSQTLLPQVEALAQQVSSKDLLLVDREVTGDNFMMPPRILSLIFNRPSVYFFNPEDLAKIDRDGFERIILITPTEKIPFYKEALQKELPLVGEFTFQNDHSFRTSSLSVQATNLPQKNKLITPVSLLELP